MHFNPYGGPAALVAADLVNAGSASELLAGMVGNGMAIKALTDTEADRIAAWARRLRPVFAASPGDRPELVNELLAEAACRPYITTHDGKPPHLHYSAADAGPVGRVRAYTAGGLAHLVCEAPDRLGICSREGCETAYVDTSRNGRRRFCSTRCATRVHVAEHRARQVSA
ncbi:CGNR zinc finger domain-containing protein [Amycolatopsis sp. MtRt-6]|uniref:CGNR zinc finger domain-containing protein n=1 Tax=Amycolatopsis sp. MtRt-6 TaxID=2792782 RepID=UPI001A8CA0A6|nr:CGNR zinc finger domain-containing protein [Amycolatopsis sp. MtRt-6]